MSESLSLILPGDGTDFAHWRGLARWLLAQDIPPAEVNWHTEQSQIHHPDLFAPAPSVTELASLPSAPERAIQVPRWWLAEAEQCLLHSSPDRFGLLYRLLWRMQQEPGLRHDPLDPDRVQLQRWLQSIRRDVHKMHAFVRFRSVALADHPMDGSGPLHIAWFEPQHHIVQAVAPFFVRRFTNLRWAILTPQCSLRWWPQAPDVASLAEQGIGPEQAFKAMRSRPGVLSWGAGAEAADAPAADAGESLWLTYYAHSFNPARLKVAAMCREMPRRYWHNLPEAQLIDPLVQSALARSAQMLAQAPSMVQRRIPTQNTTRTATSRRD